MRKAPHFLIKFLIAVVLVFVCMGMNSSASAKGLFGSDTKANTEEPKTPAANASIANQPAEIRAHIRGTVESYKDSLLVINTPEGEQISVPVKSNTHIMKVTAPVTIDDIHAGDRIIALSTRGPGGEFHAIRAHIIPAAQDTDAKTDQARWDVPPGSLITNGIVQEISKRKANHIIKTKCEGAGRNSEELNIPTSNAPDTMTANIIVMPRTVLLGLAPSDAKGLQPNTPVFVNQVKESDGKLFAGRITIGNDGTIPPM